MKQPHATKIIFATALALAEAACLPAADSLDDASLGAEDLDDDDKGILAVSLEHDAPDTLAVLEVANTYSVEALVATGVTKRVAKNIEAARAAKGAFASLDELDKVKRVGSKVIGALLTYVTKEQLFPPSVRIPTVSVLNYLPFASWFGEAFAAAGLPRIPRHLWLNDGYSHADFFARLEADLAMIGEDAATIESYLAYGTFKNLYQLQHAADRGSTGQPCWIGDPIAAVDVLALQSGTLFREGYEIFGWNFGGLYDVIAPGGDDFTDDQEWRNHSPHAKTVMIAEGIVGRPLRFTTFAPCRSYR